MDLSLQKERDINRLQLGPRRLTTILKRRIFEKKNMHKAYV
jgi:hypothetical protein